MKALLEWFVIICRLLLLVTSLVWFVAGVASCLKDDPAHIWVAYFAGTVAWIEMSGWLGEWSEELR